MTKYDSDEELRIVNNRWNSIGKRVEREYLRSKDKFDELDRVRSNVVRTRMSSDSDLRITTLEEVYSRGGSIFSEGNWITPYYHDKVYNKLHHMYTLLVKITGDAYENESIYKTVRDTSEAVLDFKNAFRGRTMPEKTYFALDSVDFSPKTMDLDQQSLRKLFNELSKIHEDLRDYWLETSGVETWSKEVEGE